MMQTVRLTRDVRIPFVGRPPKDPVQTIAIRCAGAFISVFSVAPLATGVGLVAAVIVAALLLPGLLMVVHHNRRVAREALS